MAQANKFRLGLFVLAGILLFLVGLFFLGLSDLFVRKAHFVSLFPESVQGLTVGSSVKYKGVPIGTVANITIQVEDKLVRVDMDINLSSFSAEEGLGGKNKLEVFNKFIIGERGKGLRSRLEYAGITGLKYIELDYFKTAPYGKTIPPPKTMPELAIYLPSTPSAFRDILQLINTSLERIAKVDFEGLSKRLTAVLESTRKIVADPKLSQAVTQLESMSANLNKSSKVLSEVMTPGKVREIINNVDRLLDKLHQISKALEVQLKEAHIAETADSFRKAANSVTEGRSMIAQTLLKFNQAIDAFTELLNYLNDDPEALLKGKSKPKIVFPEDH
ncbi:MAG: MlaD family protein [Victivallaceae bacterium]|nr:MlaD family protein [Victivallaceae bacterium]